MKNQRKQIVRRPKTKLALYIQSHLDRLRRNMPFVCDSGLTCTGDECPLFHPRNSTAHRTTTCLSDPHVGGSDLVVKHDGGGLAWDKQNKYGGEDPSWFQRGFGSSELLGGCCGFDGRRGWGAGIGGSNLGKANAAGWASENDGVSSWGKECFSGGGWVKRARWDFISKNEETNGETNTVDDEDAWVYKPKAGASSSIGSWGTEVINGK
ncbi:hypothetical protein HA466_0199140 [Hirschfeldia incana]|nr:hypothetical protein HA466_0199140 [Hirschfeldia incana]